MNMVKQYNGSGNPQLEPTVDNHTLISWIGGPVPRAIEGMPVGYCSHGMMCLGRMNTPIRYAHVTSSADGLNIMELMIPMEALLLLKSPQELKTYKSSTAESTVIYPAAFLPV